MYVIVCMYWSLESVVYRGHGTQDMGHGTRGARAGRTVDRTGQCYQARAPTIGAMGRLWTVTQAADSTPAS